jgi:hypothetical protein
MTHGGCRGFTNVVLTEVDGKIVLDSHATGGCVIEWRTWTGTRQLEWKIKKNGPVSYCPLCKD